MKLDFGFSGLLFKVRLDALIKLFGGCLGPASSGLDCGRYVQHRVLAGVHRAVKESQLAQGKFCRPLTWLSILVPRFTKGMVLGELTSAFLPHL